MSESRYAVRDPRFRDLILGSAALETIHTGSRWAEGPVWFKDHNCLLWSDIPNNRILRYIPELGVSVFRAPADFANGHTRDGEGRLLSCEHGARRVTRTEPDGRITVLADRFAGKRLNSPNDLVVHDDGGVWFTDPTYGIMTDYEGYKATPEQTHRHVFRIDPATGAIEAVASDFNQPNGLAFSPDQSLLYVADSGASHDEAAPRHIRVFDVVAGRTLANPRVFCTLESGIPDGLRVDIDGNVWTSGGPAVHCYAQDGTLLGQIAIPETVSNLTFGGSRGNRLFITATSSVYALFVATRGAAGP